MSEQSQDPQQSADQASVQKNRRMLLMIFGIAFASLGGSYLLFYVAQGSGVWGTTNNGAFIDPPLHVDDLGLVTEAGVPVTAGEEWRLLISVRGDCDAQCEHALLQTRQLHILLNKEASRVRRALVSDGSLAADAHLADYPKAEHLIARPQLLENRLERGIYIVDPLGNLVFYYPLEDAGKPVLDDLKKLLKLSQIG
jgi:hypothetical protein